MAETVRDLLDDDRGMPVRGIEVRQDTPRGPYAAVVWFPAGKPVSEQARSYAIHSCRAYIARKLAETA